MPCQNDTILWIDSRQLAGLDHSVDPQNQCGGPQIHLVTPGYIQDFGKSSFHDPGQSIADFFLAREELLPGPGSDT